MSIESRFVLESLQEAVLAGDDDGPIAKSVVMETFNHVRAMMARDDRGWEPVFNGGDSDIFGLTLTDLKRYERDISESMIGAPWMGRGFRLRTSYVNQNGVRYGNIPETGTRGKANIRKIVDRAGNQEHFFGPEARKRREGRLYSSGISLWIGDEKTKDLETLPLRQVTEVLLDENGLGIVWAYKREWEQRDSTSGKKDKHVRWYFTDRYVSKRVSRIKTAGDQFEEVDQDHVVFDQHANRLDGFPLGAPDALAAYAWNAYARDAYMDGKTMQEALATFAFKATTKTGAAGQNASIQFASPQGAGSTAVVGQNDLAAMASAGKGYDFASIRSLLAVVAAALDVSVIHLSANPADAGSSYGSAQTLDLPTRLAMEDRRKEHVELDKRVLRWMGLENPDVTFVPFDSGEETYRSSQALLLEYAADIYTRQELRDMVDDLHSRPNGTVPPEKKAPSITKADLLAKITAANTPEPDSTSTDGTTPKQAASPAQGRSNGTGGQDGGSASNDIRRD